MKNYYYRKYLEFYGIVECIHAVLCSFSGIYIDDLTINEFLFMHKAILTIIIIPKFFRN